jgi:hypothetical protein
MKAQGGRRKEKLLRQGSILFVLHPCSLWLFVGVCSQLLGKLELFFGVLGTARAL